MTGRSSPAADGTQVDTFIDNLLAETSIRYGGTGGIAYHYVSDTYIALFSKFIPVGVWEAVHIIRGLLDQQSKMKPDTIHADTQGQALPVYALAHLFGFELMPRVRNWKDLNFYLALRELPTIGPRTVVWLNEAQFYLDVPDGLGERVAAGLRELLRDPAPAPGARHALAPVLGLTRPAASIWAAAMPICCRGSRAAPSAARACTTGTGTAAGPTPTPASRDPPAGAAAQPSKPTCSRNT